MAKTYYYKLDRILKEQALYYMIIGERSNGKTFSVLEYGLKDYCINGNKMALIRRWDMDFKGKNGQAMFESIVKAGLVEKYTKGQWTNITYFSSRWYLSKYDEELDKEIKSNEPFCYAFALNTSEHDKSTSYPDIKTILFDEFLSRKGYIMNEFVEFMNVLSTIIRERDDVKIFMCANTVNKYAPYFTEMGLTNVPKMKQGTIDIYSYGDTELKVAVEYCSTNTNKDGKKGKKSDKYFAFNNPRLNMITGGAWEIDIYPHLQSKYTEKDIMLKYFIEFDRNLLECDIVCKGSNYFTYIHRKTTPLKYPDKEIVFSQRHDSRINWGRKITKPKLTIERKILNMFVAEKVFYQDNEVGEIVRNYLKWCKTDLSI